MAGQIFDVIVVGGGIVGTAIALELLERDAKLSVALIEKASIGAGSTSRSAAAFRHQFSSQGNILLSQYSYEVFKGLSERFKVDEGIFRENGYLFLYTQQALLDKAASRVEIQKRHGVDVHLLDPSQVDSHERLKGVFDIEALVGATWCEKDGFLDPLLVAQTFFGGAKALGATYINDEVTALAMEASKVIGVECKSSGRLLAKTVINASGWLSNKILDQHSLSLPIIPIKRYLYITTPVRGMEVNDLPMVVCDLEPYMRPEAGNALLMGWDALPRVPSHDSLRATVDFDKLEAEQDIVDSEFTNDEYGLEVRVRMAEVVPLLESDQLKLFQETCGYYQITADEKPILSWDPRAEGLLHSVGFSGHGVMHSPAAACIIADMVLGQEKLTGFEEGTFALQPLLDHKERPDPEHMSI